MLTFCRRRLWSGFLQTSEFACVWIRRRHRISSLLSTESYLLLLDSWNLEPSSIAETHQRDGLGPRPWRSSRCLVSAPTPTDCPHPCLDCVPCELCLWLCVCLPAACPCAPYVSLCLALYLVSFVLLFDASTLGLHFLCAQRVFYLYCMWTSRCFMSSSSMWFQCHMLCVFSVFRAIFYILFAVYMFVCVCFGACVTVRRCLLAFIVCCVFPVLFLLVCVCKGSVAIFSFVCTYISHFMTVM